MNVSPITSSNTAPAAAALLAAQSSAISAATIDADRAAVEKTTTGGKNPASATRINDPAAVKKAASQFEAIILRQLLAPTIEPIMSGGLGGASSGNGVYGYMLTDSLADNLAKGGGLGLAQMMEKQLTPHPLSTDIIRNSNDLKHPTNLPSP
jgi:flagellar protein FlgJ